jgi:chemotaxis protein CheX
VKVKPRVDPGPFQGTLLISFDEIVYLKMVTSMLGEEQTGLNADNADAVGEVANMILGNAKSDFTEYEIGMSLPKLLKKGVLPEAPNGSAEILIAGEVAEKFLYIQVIAHPVAAGVPAAA